MSSFKLLILVLCGIASRGNAWKFAVLGDTQWPDTVRVAVLGATGDTLKAADGSDSTTIVDGDSLPVYPETRALCEALHLDPLGLIASGALLAAVSAESAVDIVQALKREGIAATVIGRLRETPGVMLRDAHGERPLPTFTRDEIARFFDTL